MTTTALSYAQQAEPKDFIKAITNNIISYIVLVAIVGMAKTSKGLMCIGIGFQQSSIADKSKGVVDHFLQKPNWVAM